jgi:hypothetical protein
VPWYCEECGEEVDPHDVTYEETHDERAGGCGHPVYWIDEEVCTVHACEAGHEYICDHRCETVKRKQKEE